MGLNLKRFIKVAAAIALSASLTDAVAAPDDYSQAVVCDQVEQRVLELIRIGDMARARKLRGSLERCNEFRKGQLDHLARESVGRAQEDLARARSSQGAEPPNR